MLFGLIPKKDRKGKGVDPAERPRRVASDGAGPILGRRERKELRSRSHSALDKTEKRRSIFGRLWHEHTHHAHHEPEHLVQDPSSSTYAGHPAFAEPPKPEPKPEPKPKLLPPPKKKKKEMTTLKEAAKAMPALREESEPPSPITKRGLMDLAEILADTGPHGKAVQPVQRKTPVAPQPAPPEPAVPGSPTPPGSSGVSTPERRQPATPPATPFVPETRPRTVSQLAPVLEMDHALALSQATFDDPSPKSTPSNTNAPTPPPNVSRAEPATPPATPMPPTERFAHRSTLSASSIPEPATPPATPLSPTAREGRVRHTSQLATVLEVEHRLSTLDMGALKDEAEAEGRGKGEWETEGREPATPPATPASPLPRASRQWRLSAIPPVLEWDGEVERAIAAAVGREPQQVGETPAESGVRGAEKKIKRKPVTLVAADEDHVATAMAEHISKENTQIVVLGPVPARTPSPRPPAPTLENPASEVEQRVPTALNTPSSEPPKLPPPLWCRSREGGACRACLLLRGASPCSEGSNTG